MAKAVRSLSPKQIQERIRRHRHAVMVLALMRAKTAVQAQMRADGQKISQFSAKEITQLAEDYFAKNMEGLIAKAVEDINTWPGFARYRVDANIKINAQTERPPISTTSTLQISGAK